MRTYVAGAALALVLSQAAAHAEGADETAVRGSVVENWSIDIEAAKACPQQFRLRIDLAPDGTVQNVALADPPSAPETSACKTVVEGAKRAVLKASPLKGSNGIAQLDLVFDPSVVQ